jgi:hypothetical protein
MGFLLTSRLFGLLPKYSMVRDCTKSRKTEHWLLVPKSMGFPLDTRLFGLGPKDNDVAEVDTDANRRATTSSTVCKTADV